MKLTFEQNKFVLTCPPDKSPTSPEWRSHNVHNGYFTTRNIKEAARFRSAADSRTEKIFNKFMLQTVPIPPGGPYSPKDMPLMNFQLERGVPHILGNNKSYLAHDPGLGKTAQAISAVSTKPGRTLIIVPAFLKTTWAREITKWYKFDFPNIQILNSHETQIRGDFVIVSDAMLEKEWVRKKLCAEKFRYVFIDEAHRYKNPIANRTIALFGGKNKKVKSNGLIYESEHVSALSGTPMLGKAIELWPVLRAMAPETIDFMSYLDFGFRFGNATRDDQGRWQFLGSSNEEELKSRIQKRFMQRIKKEDVLPDLPKKVREVITVSSDTRHRGVVAMDRELLAKLENGFDKPETLSDYAIVRHQNGLSKTVWAANFVGEYLKTTNESIILFAHHRDVVQNLAHVLRDYKPLIINGGVDARTRVQTEDAFQSGKCRLLIGNIDAMNLGLTLTRANRVVFAEYSWTPALNIQAEDRANRIGSKWSVFCQYLTLPNSIDEHILISNIAKQERIERVIG